MQFDVRYSRYSCSWRGIKYTLLLCAVLKRLYFLLWSVNSGVGVTGPELTRNTDNQRARKVTLLWEYSFRKLLKIATKYTNYCEMAVMASESGTVQSTQRQCKKLNVYERHKVLIIHKCCFLPTDASVKHQGGECYDYAYCLSVIMYSTAQQTTQTYIQRQSMEHSNPRSLA